MSHKSRVTSHDLYGAPRPSTALRAGVIALTLIIILLALAPPTAAREKFKHGMLTIVQGTKRVILVVEVADTPETRAQGLMFRTRLDEHAGMLFIFDAVESWGFWMKNTLIPLSIAFIDEGPRIVDIKDMQVAPDPQRGPFDIYQPEKPFKYALEVNQGFFERQGITVGAKVSFVLKQP